MKTRRPQAAFLRQGLLIAAPVVLLSAVALYLLRMDRAAILQDAREHANPIASELAAETAREIGKGINDNLSAQYSSLIKPENEQLPQWILQGITLNGQVLFPFEYPRLPAPPDWPAHMTPQQLRLWQSAEAALFQKRDVVAARNAVAALKAAGLPEAACADAALNLLVLEAGQKNAPNVARRLTELARAHRNAETATGTPIADIALLQALNRADADLMPDVIKEVSGQVRSYPSFLTPSLLDAEQSAAAGSFDRNVWRLDEQTRNVLRTFIRQWNDPARSTLWFEADGKQFLALCGRTMGIATYVALIPGEWINDILDSVPAGRSGRVPPYAGVTFVLGDRVWRIGMNDTTGDIPVTNAAVLSSATAKITLRSQIGVPSVAFQNTLRRVAPDAASKFQAPRGAGINTVSPLPGIIEQPLNISLVLTKPDMLYSRYHQRMWLMAGFVLLATGAAAVGLIGAWRAFQRQVRLAEMTSNFVSSVSHELRAPLASVRLMAESLEQGRVPDPDKQKGYYNLIVRECRRLTALVENVLDFSRIPQGRKNYEFEPVDALALVSQTIQLMTPMAHDCGIVLELTKAGHQDAPQPNWDGQAVQQALVNLIDNAVKHSPPGATVVVDYQALEKQICISVSDQGPGIPPEEHGRIFEPFYRRGSELRRETKGIGIGLSIVRHVADAHGGRVVVESKTGQGSRFTLQLPA